MSTALSSALKALGETIAPPRCINCLKAGGWLCISCRTNLTPIHQKCILCHQPNGRGRICPHCQKKSPLRGVISFGSYNNPTLRRGIEWLKFKGVRDIAPTLSALLLNILPLISPISVLRQQAILVPIPLHHRRLRQRGFNQSELIAQHLTSLASIPTGHLIKRQRSTTSQASLGKLFREENMADAFIALSPSGSNKKIIILVDDVTTSGSTLTAAARAIPNSPKQQIWGLTLAQG